MEYPQCLSGLSADYRAVVVPARDQHISTGTPKPLRGHRTNSVIFLGSTHRPTQRGLMCWRQPELRLS